MATNLGKRKRRTAEKPIETRDESSQSESEALDPQEIFRRHFEAQFKPLPVVQKAPVQVESESDDDSGDESNWDGISDDEEDGVQVVEHANEASRLGAMSKEELKKFMSHKPPSSATNSTSLKGKVEIVDAEEDTSEAANLKKDLALQRLLAESHLLESSSNPTLSGSNRHKATDMRLQALGSKTSILKQEKMPMSHRKGIIAKQAQREDTRRREARENGIILEKAKMGIKNGSDGKRDRGVGAPSVGKFSSGTLKLSKRDISEIEGPRKTFTGKSSRGGRGGARGGGRGKRR